MNNVLSNASIIKIEIPQGTVLRPILFITYINSLLKLNVHGSITSYADDTALIFKGKIWEEVRENATTFSNIPIDDAQISEVLQTKYLGIIIHGFLKWQPHIDDLADKIRKLYTSFI